MRDKVINLALSQLGYKEKANGWTKYGQWYTDNLLKGTKYDFSKSDWCVMFITWCMLNSGVSPNAYPTTSPQGSSVGYNLRWMEAKGYRTGSDDMPKVGDLVYYSWSNNEWDHIGLCIKVDGTTAGNAVMTVIEGNYNNGVGQRRIAYRDKRVAATCRIPYGEAKKDETVEPVKEINEMPELSFLLKTGNKNNVVEVLQAALIGNGYAITGGVDGYFGKYTKSALIQYQKDKGLVCDGTAGTETFRSLLFG